FFFQAEDGIRDFHVTGVQTYALPICQRRVAGKLPDRSTRTLPGRPCRAAEPFAAVLLFVQPVQRRGSDRTGRWRGRNAGVGGDRSEERRVGKECRAGCALERASGDSS